MAKIKTSQKRSAFSIDDMESVKLKAGVRSKRHDPAKNLSDPEFIAEALAECLWTGDPEEFKEILKAHYEAVNTAKALKRAGLSKRTFYDALAPKGNPSLATVMKMIAALREEKRAG